MKNKLKDVIILCIFSGIVSVVCTLGVYFIFPQFLCYAVYDVHATDLQEQEELPVGGTVYVETFAPTCSYLKDISICITTEDREDAYVDYVTGKLTDDTGKVLAQDSVELSEGMNLEYCAFEVEKWVTPGEVYQFSMEFPERDDVFVTFCAADAGPAEHVSLEGGAVGTENLYIRYIYGTYSKKLLAIWALAFFIGTWILAEEIRKSGRSK